MSEVSQGTLPRRRSVRRSLFWRLLPSYLVVILVGAAASLLAGEGLAPMFLERHVNSMVRTMHNLTPAAIDEGMLIELSAGYRRALTAAQSWAALVSSVAATLVALFVTRRIVGPLRELTSVSRRIAGGRYQARLDAGVPGEIGDLVDAFNTMAGTLARSEHQRVALLADVSHEFRTPLSNLRGYIEGLEDGVFEPDAGTLQACHRQVDRLQRLVDDIGLLSLAESGQLALRPRRIDLLELIEQTHASFLARFARKGVGLVTSTPDPPLWVHADPERTLQVMTNLVDNALRHTPKGGRVVLTAGRAGVAAARVTVDDTGSGIPEGDVEHLFKRFFRGDRARRAVEGGGSGIGLTLVKEFVERQGGQVGVTRGSSGAGSEFWFTLPTAAGGDSQPPANA